MSIIPKAIALDLIKKGNAKAESLVHRDEKGRRTYVSITRYDTQTTDHVLVGDGHLYGTATHASGLSILFEPAEDAAGAWDGQVASDIPPTMELDAQARALLMREAGDAFIAARERAP